MIKRITLSKFLMTIVLCCGLTLAASFIDVSHSFFVVFVVSFLFCFGLVELSSFLIDKLVRGKNLSFFLFLFFLIGYSFLRTTLYISKLNTEQIVESRLFLWSVILIIGLYQSIYFSMLKNDQKRIRLLKEKQFYLQYSFNALKSQNVIEFLQDALKNTMFLIKKDPILAVFQIEKLTSILRYLLQSRDDRFVRLGAELKNAKEYCELAEIQISKRVGLTVNITEDFNETKIPPLVFQMVLDNQFKKFATSKEEELDIEVYVENKKFVVVKTSFVASFENNSKNQQFINNLKQRYQLYNKASGVSELSTADDYFVKFPLVID